MPELPDIEVYLHALRRRVIGNVLTKATLKSPFFLRTFDPPLSSVVGHAPISVERLGKRIVFGFDNGAQMVVHLMVAGRFRWSDDAKQKAPSNILLATLQFERGTLHVTEASKKKRASLQLFASAAAVSALDPGGLEVAACSPAAFAERLRLRNHTLKRALTDPRLFSGIGNAYSDEILNGAGLSPVALTQRLDDAEVERLRLTIVDTLERWKERLLKQFGDKFPGGGEITAFRPDFSVHGKYGEPCLRCGTTVQRIRYAENETNYCPRCQTGGKILADRSLSRILKDDWPRSIEELEAEG